MAIPKIVHYCWFGGKEKPDSVKKCIESWKKFLPDYQLMEWNEDNFNIEKLKYTKEAYAEGKYAFVSDVARIEALYQYGGIYMDTDVEVLKSFNSLLNTRCILGMEEKEYVATSFMAFEKGHPLVKEFLKLYENIRFLDEDGQINTGTNVAKLTNMLMEKGFVQENHYQEFEEGIKVYPKDFFSPYDYINCYSKKTNNTYTMHHFYKSWVPFSARLKAFAKKSLAKTFGGENIAKLRNKFQV